MAIASPKDRKVERKQDIFGSLTMEAADCALGPLSAPILGSNRLINADIWSTIFASTCASMVHIHVCTQQPAYVILGSS